jgi:hypothetical protein
MDKIDYLDIENKLIEIRNRLPLISPNMNKSELHHLSCIKSGIDLAVSHLIKLINST